MSRMEIQRFFFRHRFLRFTINTFFGSPVIYLIFLLFLFPACAGKKMSVEEAKQVTISMSETTFAPPPRRISDILTILDKKSQFDPASIRELKAKADKSPPEKEDNTTLANFYYHRGQAASLLGRFKQSLEDYRTAFCYYDIKDPKLIRGGEMTKAEIVENISSRTGLTKKEVAEAVDQFLACISKGLAEGKHYEIRGFGTFKVKARKSRMARNPRTGEPVPVPDRKVPVFKVSRELKELVAQS